MTPSKYGKLTAFWAALSFWAHGRGDNVVPKKKHTNNTSTPGAGRPAAP